MIFLIILSCLLWIAAVVAIPRRIILAPVLSYSALILLSMAKNHYYPIVPLSSNMLVSWLCITLVMTLIIVLQNPAVRSQSRGTGYMILGGITGMAIGLAGFSLTSSLTIMYALMLVGTIAGIFLGFLLFTRTPDGAAVAPPSGHFFRYLVAKGFPILITLAQPGIVAVILIASASI